MIPAVEMAIAAERLCYRRLFPGWRCEDVVARRRRAESDRLFAGQFLFLGVTAFAFLRLSAVVLYDVVPFAVN